MLALDSEMLHRLVAKWQAQMLTPKALRDYCVLGFLLLFTFLLDVTMKRVPRPSAS